MAQRLDSLIDALALLVCAVAPRTNPGAAFTRLPEDAVVDLDTLATSPRVFAIEAIGAAASQFTDDGNLAYIRHELALRAVYPVGAFRKAHERANAIGQDTADLVSALRPPAGWSSLAHYLEVRATETQRADVTGNEGQVLAHILTIPMTCDLEA